MKRTSLLLLTCIMAFTLMAQIPQDPTYGLTPNAKSFQRYGDIPVSLYTGTPNITIPLDTIHDGTLSLPVALSYHCGGVKADEHPGWVGLGWTLLLGGAITREVRDMPDEYDYSGEYGYYYNHDMLDSNSVWETEDKVVIDSYVDNMGFVWRLQDTEPDKFSFQFGEYSGFFILDSTGEWQVYSNRPLRLKQWSIGEALIINGVRANNQSRMFTKFTLTTEDGVDYEFGNDAIDLSINFRHQKTSGWASSAWHLKKITHPNGDSIEFEYERIDYVASLSYCDEFRYICNHYDADGKPVGVKESGTKDPYQGSLMSPVYLKKVTGNTFKLQLYNSVSDELNYEKDHYQCLLHYDGGPNDPNGYDAPIFLSIDDTYDTDGQLAKIKWHKLDSIKFINGKSQEYRRIKFDYVCDNRVRLALQAVTSTDRFGFPEETYRFRYRNLWEMPRYLSRQSDHWGYYNGTDYSAPSKPSSLNPNAETLLYGTLEDITYPYGGKTIFEFEPHTYSKVTHYKEFGDMVDMDEKITGGVRIRKIINIPNDSTPAWNREFRYVYNYTQNTADGISSGILEGYPTYNMDVPIPGGQLATEGSTASLSHIINSSGLHIGYPEVVELHDDGGYEIHRFTSCLDTEYQDIAPVRSTISPRFVPISSMAHYRGYPMWDKYFNKDGKILKHSSYAYGRIAADKMYAPGIYSPLSEYIVYSFYKNYVFNLVRTKEEHRVYSPVNTSGSFSTVTYKRYNALGQLKSDSTVTFCNGSPVRDVTSYTYEWENNKDFSGRFYMSYIGEVARSRNGNMKDRTIYSYSLSDEIPYVSRVSLKNPSSMTKTLYACSKVNVKGQPVEVFYSDMIPVVYLWGKDYLHPTAVIKGCNPIQAASLLGFSPEQAPDYTYSLRDKIKRMRDNMPMCEITEYSYTPHVGVRSITAPSGKTTYYDYDTYSRLISVSDTRKDQLSGYLYSSFSASESELDYATTVRNYLDRNISIIGPRVINPDSIRYYWANIEDLGLPYRWSIDGDSSVVKINHQGRYLAIQPTAKWELYKTRDLKLTVFNKDGSELWSLSHELLKREHYYKLKMDKVSSSTEKVDIVLTIHPVDPNGNVSGVYVRVNGKTVGSVTKKTDEQFGAASSGVRGAIQIPRDYTADFYQITLISSSLEDTWVYSTDELFSSPTQE